MKNTIFQPLRNFELNQLKFSFTREGRRREPSGSEFEKTHKIIKREEKHSHERNWRHVARQNGGNKFPFLDILFSKVGPVLPTSVLCTWRVFSTYVNLDIESILLDLAQFNATNHSAITFPALTLFSFHIHTVSVATNYRLRR